MSILGAALLDVVIALIMLASGVLSWLRGLVEELIAILAWVLSLLVAFQFAEFAAQFFPETLDSITMGERSYDLTEFHAPAAGVLLFLIIFILVSQLHRITTQLAEGGSLKHGDRALGFLFGLVRGALVVLLLVLIAGTTAIPETGFWNESSLIPYFVDAGREVISWMPEDWQDFFHYPEPEEP